MVVTRIRRAVKRPLDTPSTFEIFSEEQYKNTGTFDLSKVLTILAQSFKVPLEPTCAFAAQIPARASLRGLASNPVLILN